jgi:hypothetical protein
MNEMNAAESNQTHDTETRKRKRGEIREDGMVFWAVVHNKELWLTPEKFAEMQARMREKYLANAEKIKAKLRQKYAENPEPYKEKAKRYAKENEEKVRAKARRYQQENREERKEYLKQWYQQNKKEVVQKQKEYIKANPDVRRKARKNWLSKNRQKLNIWRAKNARERRANDPLFALKQVCRTRIKHALDNKGLKKNFKIRETLGCSWEELKSHVESLFVDGMSWVNRSEWHLDHVIPLCLAQDAVEVMMLNHYTNLQPLWVSDNLTKNDELPENFLALWNNLCKLTGNECKIRM